MTNRGSGMISELIQSIENEEERQAVETIYKLYFKPMMAKAYSILKNYHDAEDAVQETFYRISCHVQSFMNPLSEDTVALISIYTRNVAINMYNRKKKQQTIFDMDQDVNDMNIADESAWNSIEELVINDETVNMVRNALNRLDEMHRDVILLKYYYHMRNIDIGKVLDIDSNTVNGRIYRAKKMLRQLLGEEGYERITYRHI